MIELRLTDFNDLYVIAVGLSMAYLCIERYGSDNSFSFITFLSKYSKIMQGYIVGIRSRKKHREEEVIARTEYLYEKGDLKEETKGALHLISIKAREVTEKYAILEKHSEAKIEKNCKTDFIHVISFDCFLYGLSLLYIGAYEAKGIYDIKVCLLFLNILIMLFALHCIVADRWSFLSSCKWIKPSKILHVLLAVVGVVIYLIFKNSISISPNFHIFDIETSPFFCFAGFIIYLIISAIGTIFWFIIYAIRIFCVDAHPEEHEEDLNRFKTELDEAEKKINESLSKELTIE